MSEVVREGAHGLKPNARLRAGAHHTVVWIIHSACACPTCIVIFPSHRFCESRMQLVGSPCLFFFFFEKTNLRTNILIFLRKRMDYVPGLLQ